MSDTPARWERQQNESAVAFAAFARYRDMGPDQRAYREVARQLGKSSALIGRWSRTHQWVARAEAFDAHQVAEARKKARKRKVDTVQGHLTAANALLAQSLTRLRPTPLVEPDGTVVRDANGEIVYRPAEAAELSASATALDKAIKHQRLALGLPTEHTKQDVVLRETLEATLDTQRTLRTIIEEQLCVDCRKKVGAELARLSRQQDEIADEVMA